MNAFANRTRLAIIFAMDSEARGLIDMLPRADAIVCGRRGAVSWYMGRSAIMVSVSGVGGNNARRAAEQAMDAGADMVLNAGYCGALARDLDVGDVVVGTSVCLLSEKRRVLTSSEVITRSFPPDARFGYAVLRGPIVTTDQVVSSSERKLAIYRETEAFAVDMEAYHVADACRGRGVPFATVKCVTDSAGPDVPAIVEQVPYLSWCRLVLRVLLSPSSWSAMLRLMGGCKVATRNLADALGLALLRLA